MSLINDQKRMAMCEVLRRMGISNKRVLKSMACVPRHCFVPSFLRDQAYENGALPIGYDQTISQPYIVALMCEAAALKSSDRVLEIGTGSGYGAAILAGLASHVYSIEIVSELKEAAQTLLKKLGYSNVTVLQGDGSIGLVSEAPFDAIVSTANAPYISNRLKGQLVLGGRLITPVQHGSREELVKITRLDKNTYQEQILEEVQFVPLRGQEGWSKDH